MNDIIKITKVNEVYMKITTAPHIIAELGDYFSFDVPNAKFSALFKEGKWKGQCKLFNQRRKTIYCGLLKYVEEFCKTFKYDIEYNDDFSATEFSVREAQNFINSLKLPERFQIRDYQMDGFVYSVRNHRSLILSPTSSGKSILIYLLTKFYNKKTLIIVPNISLAIQLTKDFYDYEPTLKGKIHTIAEGTETNSDKKIIISTWQAIYNLPEEYFNQYEVVIGDEAHLYTANSLVSIMKKCINVKYRFGTTGTLDNIYVHKLVLQGLFGIVREVTSTRELIDKGYISDVKIKCIVLKYPQELRRSPKKMTYQEEISFLIGNRRRNKFITNLALSLKGNTLILFRRVDDHGKVLYASLNEEIKGDRPLYYISGEVSGEDREAIRQLIEDNDDVILLGSIQTTGTGINIKRIHNIIFATPSKSRVAVLQNLGRGLRLAHDKKHLTLFDIVDNISWNDHKNYSLVHFFERIKLYNEQQLDYRLYNVQLEDLSSVSRDNREY